MDEQDELETVLKRNRDLRDELERLDARRTELQEQLNSNSQEICGYLEEFRTEIRGLASMMVEGSAQLRSGSSDIVQDTFLQVYQTVRRESSTVRIPEDRDGFRAWIRRISRNLFQSERRRDQSQTRDVRRTKSIDDGTDHDDGGQTPSKIVASSENEALLTEIVNTLSEADRMLLRLRYFNEWSHMDLAQLLEGEASNDGRMRVQRRIYRLLMNLKTDTDNPQS